MGGGRLSVEYLGANVSRDRVAAHIARRSALIGSWKGRRPEKRTNEDGEPEHATLCVRNNGPANFPNDMKRTIHLTKGNNRSIGHRTGILQGNSGSYGNLWRSQGGRCSPTSLHTAPLRTLRRRWAPRCPGEFHICLPAPSQLAASGSGHSRKGAHVLAQSPPGRVFCAGGEKAR